MSDIAHKMGTKSAMLLIFALLFSLGLQAQLPARGYPQTSESRLMQTQWQYTYSTHAESNTIIHKADGDYRHYLFLKFDGSLQTYLHGRILHGNWSLNAEKNQIRYEFRRLSWWHIVEHTDNLLVLEYVLANGAAYRYHFVPLLESESQVFERSAFDLPDVIVVRDPKAQPKERYRYRKNTDAAGKRPQSLAGARREARRQAKLARNPVEKEAEFLQIELVGGGFVAGMDRVYKNNLVIKTNGQVVKEYHTELQGYTISRRTISRKMLEDLVAYIESKKFFEMPPTFGCLSGDCQERMQRPPRPIALRIAVTRGQIRKLVSVPIWDGRGAQHSPIPYPPALDSIVRTIENVALY